MTVGRSWRTPAKHDLMRSLIGKEVGVSGLKPDILRSVWYDLTAGDGVISDEPDPAGRLSEWGRDCSPGILAHHAKYHTKPVDILLYEIKPNTFNRLVDSLTDHLPILGYVKAGDTLWHLGPTSTPRVRLLAINGSGADANVAVLRRGDAVFALNDPNAITDWAMRPDFATEVDARTPWFRSLSTMGCNTGGLKRLDLDEHRLKWFELIADQERGQPRHRDLLLSAIEGDDAQWAYLMGEPRKWQPAMEVTARTSFKRFNLAIKTAWWRTEPDAFTDLKRQLFLTRNEREGGAAA